MLRPTVPCHTETSTDVNRTQDCFRHETLFYAGDNGFLEGTLSFVNDAIAAEEPILVAVGSARIGLLREALGGDAELVVFADMEPLGRNPARMIPAWREFLEEKAPDGRPVRGISEPIWPGRSQAETTECERHELLVNLVFDQGQAWRLLCLYDLDGLEEQVIVAAQRSHPFIVENGGSRRSDAYLGVHEAPNPFEGALPEPSTPVEELAFAGEDLGVLRRLVREWAAGTALGAERTELLVLATNELATNSVRHGGGRGSLLMWREPEAVVCEVRDGGRIEEPLTGRTRPAPDQLSGRGLWLVNHVCDLVQIRAMPPGNVVRIQMRLI
jgi:anti-sigma regulatory factor (Ser/Thr protein kinase)